MANKYSRYELMPFPSLYVDQKKPEIAQLLANRYDANKQSKDLIDRTLAQLEVLDGDKAHVERVKMHVKGMLKEHVSRGDWENSSLVVQDAAQAVETDQGLIAANKSMKNRAAEIAAIREAKLNGIPMIDFGAEQRSVHQSYYYDEDLGTYVSNIYEPMSQTMLDYRTRKEAMIGKIPADQRHNIQYINRKKTNKIANLLVEQYIADTKEGIQEFRKLVEIDLPQTLPLEERIKMAKASILNDFQEAAQQQEFKKVASVKGGGSRSSGSGVMPPGLTIKSNQTGEVNTAFDHMDDKIRGIQEKQLALLELINNEDTSEEDRKLYQTNFNNNAALLKANMRKVAEENGEKGRHALEKYENIEKRFNEFGADGQRLLAATQYLTYNTSAGDTDWGNILSSTAIGAGTGAGVAFTAGMAGPQAVLPEELVTVPIGTGVGAGVGFVSGLWSELSKPLRNVRDWHRPQEGGYITGSLGLTDNEREQLAEELWTDEDLEDANVDHINELLGTNFNEKDLEELMSMTNAYYTFMTKDKFRDENNNKVDRLSGDDLFEQVMEKSFVINQPVVGFDASDQGNKLRNMVNQYAKHEIDFNNAGIASDNMLPGSGDLETWIEDGGGSQKIEFEGFRMPDLSTNTPLRLTFGFEGDGTGKSSRDFYISDPTVIQPGGWVYKLMDEQLQLTEYAYDEILRQQYDIEGYDNVTVERYVNDMAIKDMIFAGGGSEEDVIRLQNEKQDMLIQNILLHPEVELPQFTNKLGQRGVQGDTGFVPFQMIDRNTGQASFNQAAWIVLQNNPSQLAGLRQRILDMSMGEFAGYNF